MKRILRRATAVFAVMLLVPIAALAQPVLLPDSSLTGDDPDGTLHAFGDAYAAAADTWGDWLFVGAPRETTFRDGAHFQDGAVYIYRNVAGSYVFQQKLMRAGSGSAALPFGDRFGAGIAAAGGWLFVASANDQDFPGLVDPREGIDYPPGSSFVFAGQVHVYRFNGSSWDYKQTLRSPSPKSNGSFGARTHASHIALDSKGKVAAIGELNNFFDGSGQIHTYRIKKGSWRYVQSIDRPSEDIDTFGDELVFANDKYLVAGAGDDSADFTSNEGSIHVYKSKGASGKFFAAPVQSITGPAYDFVDCADSTGFGQHGLNAAGGIVAVADPCVNGAAGAD